MHARRPPSVDLVAFKNLHALNILPSNHTPYLSEFGVLNSFPITSTWNPGADWDWYLVGKLNTYRLCGQPLQVWGRLERNRCKSWPSSSIQTPAAASGKAQKLVFR